MSTPSVPDSVNIHNLNGTYIMNKQLSDPFDAILTLQEVGWIVRQAAKFSSVSIKVEQADREDGINFVNITQTSSGGIRSTEERTMDWTWREKKDNIFGLVKGRSRFCKVDEIEDEYLTSELDKKSLEADGNEVVNSITESVDLAGDQWNATQVWGFEVIDGVRRHVRRILFTRGSEVHKLKTVYDWKEE
ncbi:hypothetical protein BDZ85DRAFT_310398 [Elsinoe ampelina]|uniref:Uncharacterized protein n=1 Tax=Elsinoe ampelina TaxID=302913 RepID=A0A6A6GEW2_9PEZI|nr:hypothetical protein BDZ85DRAFT_310398 [Elsinoe ampelina]